MGEGVPDVTEEVGDTHGCCEAAIGCWRGALLL